MGFLDDLLKNLKGQQAPQAVAPAKGPLPVRQAGEFQRANLPADFNLGDRLAKAGVKPASIQDRRAELPMAPNYRRRVPLQAQIPEDSTPVQDAYNAYGGREFIQQGIPARQMPQVPSTPIQMAQPQQLKRRLDIGYANYPQL